MSDTNAERVIFAENKSAALYCLGHSVQSGIVDWWLNANCFIEAPAEDFHFLNLVEVE